MYVPEVNSGYTGTLISTSVLAMLLFLYVPISMVTIICLVKAKVKVQNGLKLANQTSTNSSISQTKKTTAKAIDTEENVAYGLIVLNQ